MHQCDATSTHTACANRTEFEGFDEEETVRVGLTLVIHVSITMRDESQKYTRNSDTTSEKAHSLQNCCLHENQQIASFLAPFRHQNFRHNVQVVMTGNQAPKSVDITQEAMETGKEVG